MTDWEKEVDSIILDTVKRVKQGKDKKNQILLGDLLEIVNRFHLLRAKQRKQLLKELEKKDACFSGCELCYGLSEARKAYKEAIK